MKRKPIIVTIFVILEIICGFYILFLSSWEGLGWLFPEGIIAIALGFGLLTLKNWVRIANVIFLVIFLFLYFLLFYDLLIIRGFTIDLNNPFFFMTLIMHFPVVLFNLIFIFFLYTSKDKRAIYNK